MNAFKARSLWAWLPAVSMMLVNVLSYVDRFTLALLAPTILHDTGLSNQQYGFVISGFSITYMVCNPLWGRIVDGMGARSSMNVAASLWTLASVAHSFAQGVGGFFMARVALGLGEAGSYPSAVHTVMQTVPVKAQMRGLSVVYSGGSLGAIITPILITPVAVTWGWRGAFWFTGALGLTWLALWNLVSRRSDLAKPAAAATDPGGRPRWNDTRLWAYVSLNAFGAWPVAFVLYQSSIYLSAVLHKSQVEIGSVLWIPPLGWEVGFFFWGWVTDRSDRASPSGCRLRRQFVVMLLLSLPLAVVPFIRSYPITLALFFLAMFTASSFTIGSLAYASQHYSKSHSGFLAGLGSGGWSAVIALALPLVGKLFDGHSYTAAFMLAVALPVGGYVFWRALDRPRSKH